MCQGVVARNHVGVTELLPASLDGDKLTFETDKFSDYAVVTVTYLPGDADSSGKAETADLVRIISYLSDSTGTVNFAAADMNGYNTLDLLDLVKLMKSLTA